jgi:diguanylate cyclase (GGDEF)-like protein/PAS domain S-box-containing protein
VSTPADAAATRPAARAVVVRSRRLLVLAAVSAGLACAADAYDRITQHADGGHAHLLPRVLAAVFALCAGAAAYLAFVDRSRRDRPREKDMRLLAVGLAVLWGGQSVGYIATAPSAAMWQGWVEQVPLLVAVPMIGTALVRICWPSRMSAADARTALLDSVVAVLGFAVLWWGWVVTQLWQYPPGGRAFENLDQAVMFGLGAVVLVIATISRRIGSLPFPQLLLLAGGVMVQVLSDALGQTIPGADNSSAITWSILGYVVAVSMLVAMALRPAVEVETPWQRAARERLSIATPIVMVVPAGVLVISAAASDDDGLEGAVGIVSMVLLLALLAAVLLARLAAAAELRRVQESAVAEVLAVRTREGWFKALVGDSADGMLVVDAGGRVLYSSPRFERDAAVALREDGTWPLSEVLVDLDRAGVALLLAQVAADPSQSGPYDLLVRGRDGGELEMEAVIRPVADVELDGFVVTARDVSDARRLARQLANSRRRDELTGLLSREAFLAETAEHLDEQDERRRAGVVALDLERFAALNDGLGHAVGDQILLGVAGVIDRLPDEVHGAARMASDTFALLVMAEDCERVVVEVVEQLRQELKGLLLPDGREIEVEFHAGYVVSDPMRGDSAQWHAEAADLALARSRSSRNARLVGYREDMRDETERRLRAEAQLRRAIAEDRLEVHYQPVVRIADLVVTGAEALVRLRDEHGALVPPGDFIPLAEELGLIGQIGEAVLRRACADTARLSESVGSPLHVAVNVAVDQVQQSLPFTVRSVLEDTGLPASRLALEITESTLADTSRPTQEILGALRSMGVSVSIDDFGTGFSSLSYLARLPVDGLKIDRAFVSRMGSNEESFTLARVVVQLARELGLHTVGEGVETREQLDMLRGMGCDYSQGFLHSRPLPLAEYEAFLREGLLAALPADQG